MAFQSILFEKAEDSVRAETQEAPGFFVDLNLDQVIHAITANKLEYNLKPFFWTSLTTVDAINYRHEVMRELEKKPLYNSIRAFAYKMHAMRDHLAQSNNLHYKYQKERWFLDAVELYCNAVNDLARDLLTTALESRGLLAFREYVNNYIKSRNFTSLVDETNQLKTDLASVNYTLLIRGNSVTVSRYDAEPDYNADVEATFEKFKRGAANNYLVEIRSWPDMNHVEAQILDRVVRLYPNIFLTLDNFCSKHSNYLDETINTFDREIQFYVAYLEYIARLKQTGLKFCYPQISSSDKEVYSYEGFDLALANKLATTNSSVISNDFCLSGKERIFVVTGPNQGGKTTFARMFGQLHYLASLGCPVPGREAKLFLFDRLFTHFEKEENIQNLRGKLQDDLVRIHGILERATPDSIIIMNEIFTSTTLEDAIFLSKEVLGKIIQLDLLSVCVTFIDELAALSEKIVSLVGVIVPENPALRTYKIVRRPADGLAYAHSLAEKYRLTYDCLKARITI